MATSAEIKRINQRIKSIAQTFGTNSEMYDRITSSLLTDDFSKFVNVKNGIISIRNTKEVRDTSTGKHLTNIARKKAKTLTQIKIDAGFEKNDKIEDIIEDIEDRIHYSNNIQLVLDYLYSQNTDSEMHDILPEDFYSGETSESSIREVVDKYIDSAKKAQEKNTPFSDS